MSRWHYTFAGLRISSELELPEWAPFAEGVPIEEPDVTVSLADHAPAIGTGFPITATDYHFQIPNVGQYRVREGRRIEVTPAPHAGLREVRLFLLGSALAGLMYQRDRLVLHAGAVDVDGGVALFCGRSGAGKSTAVAWLANRGFPFAVDDLCFLGASDDGRPVVYPGTPRLKLWRDTLERFGIEEKALQRDYLRHEKYHVALQPHRLRAAVPIVAIYLLEWGEPRLCRAVGAEGLRRFVSAATYRGAMIESLGKAAGHWSRCIHLLRHAPLWEFRRPMEWSSMDDAMRPLLDHVRLQGSPSSSTNIGLEIETRGLTYLALMAWTGRVEPGEGVQ